MKLYELFAPILTEDAALDLDIGQYVETMTNTILKRVYAGARSSAWVFAGIGEAQCFEPETIGIGNVLPGTIVGFAKREAPGVNGKLIRFSKPFYQDYQEIILIYCLSSGDRDDLRKAAGSLLVRRTLRHELTHAMDVARVGMRMFNGSKELPDDAATYYNKPEEFNAYFHDVADGLTSLGGELAACHTYHDAMEVLGLFGFTGDFKHDLNVLLDRRDDRPRQAFLKWITADNRKKLLKRLYSLHAEVMRRIEALKATA